MSGPLTIVGCTIETPGKGAGAGAGVGSTGPDHGQRWANQKLHLLRRDQRSNPRRTMAARTTPTIKPTLCPVDQLSQPDALGPTTYARGLGLAADALGGEYGKIHVE
jgi:hypothetical protein